MKNSKPFFICIVASFFILFGVMNITAQTSESIKEPIKVTIYKTTSRAEVFKIVDYLSINGIDLTFDKLKYSKNGVRISNISGQIKCGDGTSGSFQAGRFFKKIEIYKNDNPGAPVGFGITVK